MVGGHLALCRRHRHHEGTTKNTARPSSWEILMAQHLSDRNLLFGLLALQLDFISRDELIAAMQAWALDRDKTLGQILVARDALDSETCALTDALVDKHVAVHDHAPARSLASVRTVPDVHEGLKQ